MNSQREDRYAELKACLGMAAMMPCDPRTKQMLEEARKAIKELQAATEQGVGEPVAWMNDKPTTMGFYIMQSIDNASETFMARVYFEQDQVCLDFYDKNTFETVSEGYLLEKFDTRYKWMQIDARPPKPTGGGVPDNWRSEIEKAVKLASVFDDGGDGADDESARSVVGILSTLLATQQPPEQE